MTLESIAWPLTPAFTDLSDGGQAYNMGIQFSHEDGGPCWGVEWRVPDTVSTPPGGTHAVAIWDVATSLRVGYQEFTPVPGGLQSVEFDTKPDLNPFPALYVATVYTVHYVFRSPTVTPVTSPSGKIVADEGRLAPFSGGAETAPYPTDDFVAWYYVSPIMDDGGSTPPSEGSVALGLDLSVSATGARNSAGSAALGLGLAVAATGSAPHGGSVALTLSLAPAATGARASLGSAALALNLSVSGAGSNGDTGCPVPPFPFTSRSVTASLTPRAVGSFPGGECT